MRDHILFVGQFKSDEGIYPSFSAALAHRLRNQNWEVITTSSISPRAWRLIDMLTTVWKQRHNYTIAHVAVFSGPAFIWAECVIWLLCYLKKPFILTLHGGNLPQFSKRWTKRVRRILNSANAVTTPSRYLLEQMEDYRENMILLPNPIDIGLYKFAARAMPRPKLLWLRAFHSTYNPALAIRVISLLCKDFEEIELTMVGPDKGDKTLAHTKQLAEEFGIANRINWIGAVPKADVPYWLNQGDIFLNTTNVDNTPISILEAMASGLCIVSTNVGGIPYLLKHEHDSLLVPPNDPDAMANAIKRILTEPEFAEKLSRNARAKAEQHDWSTILPQWEQLVTDVVGN